MSKAFYQTAYLKDSSPTGDDTKILPYFPFSQEERIKLSSWARETHNQPTKNIKYIES